MKKIFYTLLLMLAVSISANSQWLEVNVTHQAGDIPFDVEVPNAQTVWAALTNSTNPFNRFYYRTADGGANWNYGIVNAPAGYATTSLAAIDADTCYAVMVDRFFLGGGIFKTKDRGSNWGQLAVGQVFDS